MIIIYFVALWIILPIVALARQDSGSNTQRGLEALETSTGLKLLFLRSQEMDNVEFRREISLLTGGETVYLDGTRTTPTRNEVDRFDCVMVHTAGEFHNPELLGDTLADYVDKDGVVVFSDGFTGGGFTDANRGVNGRIRQDDYSPIARVGLALEGDTVYNLDGTSDIYQGIATNFRSIANNRDGDVSVQGHAIADGTFADGNIAAAYRPDFRVIYLGGSYCWGTELDSHHCPSGDSLRRWANACSIANGGTSSPSPPTPGPSKDNPEQDSGVSTSRPVGEPTLSPESPGRIPSSSGGLPQGPPVTNIPQEGFSSKSKSRKPKLGKKKNEKKKYAREKSKRGKKLSKIYV